MEENDRDVRIMRPGDGPHEEYGRPGAGPVPGGGVRWTIKGGPLTGPLIGCPLMLFMSAFFLIMIPVTIILAMLGGRRAANMLRAKAEEMRRMKTGRGGFTPADPDVIDVEAVEIETRRDE